MCKPFPHSPGSCPTMKSECSGVFLTTTKSRHVHNTHIHYIYFLSVLLNKSSALLWYIKIFHPETWFLLSSPCSSRRGHLSTCFLVHSLLPGFASGVLPPSFPWGGIIVLLRSCKVPCVVFHLPKVVNTARCVWRVWSHSLQQPQHPHKEKMSLSSDIL